jgi:hypothetical protein
VILFLDFDGVLHLEGEGHLRSDGTDFCFLPSLEALIAPLVEDIRPRILGVTPPRGSGIPHSFAHPEGGILAWLQTNGAADTPWVALDEAEWQFNRHKDRLVVCGYFVGLDAEACVALRAHFESTRP